MLRKYASLQVLEAWQAGPAPAALRKSAHRVAFDYDPRPGYLYVRSRMISSRTNDNHDTFPAAEIEKGYRTFLGKPVFVNHHNANHRRARGVIVAVALHRDRNPDRSPDTWVEGLMEVDAQRFPKLAKAILAGKVNRTSMGVDVEWSRCSACGNKATSPAEYCKHLPALKGKLIRKRNQVTGKVEQKLIHEICAGLSFFENSLLVEDPADPTAHILDKPDDRGLRMAAARRTAAAEDEPDFADHIDNACAGCGKPVKWSNHPIRGGFRHHNPADDQGHPPFPEKPDVHTPAQDYTFGGTHCLMCHDPVRINLAKMDTATGGWHHHDGMKRDHPAIPADPRAVYSDIPRQKAVRDQARARVDDVLEQQGLPRRQDAGMPPDPFTASMRRAAGIEWEGQAAADADNLYHLTGCHHVSCGRALGHRRTAVDIDESRLHRAPDPAVHPVRHVLEGARSYAGKVGLPDPHQDSYARITTTPDRIRRLAQAYDALPMDDRNTHPAFADLARQVHDQYHHLTHTMGVQVQPVDHDPYANHLEMAHDLVHNKRLQVLKTAVTGPHGFFDDGTNDKFRAVHDAFGHAATGRGFDRHGEEAAWLAHSRMFSGPAKHVMTTELRGQNAVLVATGQFAPQKTALLPHELMQRDAATRKDSPVASRTISYEPELEPQDGRIYAQAAKREAGDHPFFHETPLHADHIVAAYHDTTDDEKSLGDRWYSDAHHIAGAITGGDHALGAGLLSAYSPQTAWPVNLFNASRAAQGDPPGPGTGAMGSQQKPAMQMLAGKHHSEVLKGPKTRAFAKLIEHGDDTPEDKASGNHQVVVDRHALSVAAGRRLGKEEGQKFPAGQEQHYNHVAHMYRDAAATLSRHYGREIAPHKVQAATWLRQVRVNQEDDSAGKAGGQAGSAGKGRVQMFNNSQERWQQHHHEVHPGRISPENMHYHGQRKQAYGETRVPPQVDTLRMEECPVCGEGDVWSGDRCPVCGFVVPPSLFRDPDVTKAQEVRDQLDQSGEVVTQPGAPGGPGGQPVGSGDDADDQLVHPDQLAPDGVPTVQGGDAQQPGAPVAQQPGQQDEEQGDAEEQQGEEDQELGAQEEAEGQQDANDGEEEQLAPQGGLVCPACGQSFAPDMAAQPGVPCPACRQGALEPAGGPQKEQEDPSESEEEDEGEDMPGSKTAAAIAQAQARRIAELSARNEVLTAQLSFLARAAGADQHLAAIEQQVMQRQADMLNPASPVPDPPEAPAPESTEQALQPMSQDDPSRPGSTPGSLTGVPAQQTTTAITPGVEMQTPPASNLIDVTAPVQGTDPSQDGGVPLEQRRIETDVRVNPDPLQAHGPGIGGAGDNGTAFPWTLDARQPAGGQQKAASLQGEENAAARTFGSIRLAKLRVQAGMAQGDELAVAERIEKDASLPTAMIEHEIAVLSQVRPPAPPRGAMPRQAARQAPSLASVGASAHYAPAAYTDDLDGSDLFLS